jgi:hypothetical protein
MSRVDLDLDPDPDLDLEVRTIFKGNESGKQEPGKFSKIIHYLTFTQHYQATVVMTSYAIPRESRGTLLQCEYSLTVR